MYYLLKSFSIVLYILGKRFRQFLARCIAFILYRVLKLRRKLIIRNITTALGSSKNASEIDAIGYESYYHFANNMLEFLAAADGKLSENVAFQGSEHLEKAIEKGKGVFILCSHMGSWEAMGGAYTKRFGPTYVIVKKVGSESSNKFVEEQRARNHFMWVDRKDGKGSATKKIFKALRRNEIVGFVMDQARPGEPYLPFFGKPAKTNTSLGAFAIKGGIPVLPSYIRRTGLSSHELIIGEEITLPQSGNEEHDTLEAAKLFNKEVEKIIITHPEQYFWMHNRWK